MTPTDYLYIDVVVKHYRELKKKELVLYLQQLQQEKVTQCIIKKGSNDFIALKQDFQPVALFEELPLPSHLTLPQLNDYFLKDFLVVKSEVSRLVITKGNERFVSPHLGLKINAGEEGMSDLQVAVLSQTLSKVSPSVWHNSKSIGLFLGIPEFDLVIQIPLKINDLIRLVAIL